jgi:hypothetical protein
MSIVKISTFLNGSGIISTQDITASTSGSITFTAVQGSLPLGNAYLIVDNSGVISNNFPIFLTANASYPNKTVVLGGTGNKLNSHNNNAGFFNSPITYATMQGSNGDPLYTVSDCNYLSNSGIIHKSSAFADNLQGNWVNIILGASGTLENKRYYIQASNSDWILIGQGYTDCSNLNIRVGGALRSFEKVFSSGIIENGDTLYNTYSSGSYVMDNSGIITIYASGVGGNRPSIGGSLISLV